MTAEEKVEFITNLTASVRDALIRAVPHMPEEWDGHELRQYLADLFAREVYKDTMRGRRLREYQNHRNVTGRLP